MNRCYGIALALLACPAVALSQELAPSTPVVPLSVPGFADFSSVRSLIRTNMAEESVPGLAIVVARRDSILWEEGFGWANQEARVPATPHTPFYLASVTKTIAATAVMLLAERKLLDLDRPANAYLRTAKLSSPAWDPRDATIRRLATHTSGLASFDLSCADDRPNCRFPAHDALIREYGTLIWRPGERFDYSNLGYLILGDVVAQVSGRELGTFLREEIFLPLGMAESSLGLDASEMARAAVRYSRKRGPLPTPQHGLSAASSAYASAHDLALFGMMHAHTGGGGRPAVLSDAAIDTMQRSLVAAGGNSKYGLGWWVEEDRFGYRSLLAQGGTDAASAWLRVIPSEGIVVVVLANKGVGFPSRVVNAAIAAILPPYAERLAAQQSQTSQSATPVSPPTRAARPVDSTFMGSWRGMVRADGRVQPMTVTVTDSGTATATLGPSTERRRGRARSSEGTLRLELPGDRVTADTTDNRRLELSLRLRNGVLEGAMTSRPSIASGLEGRVTHWVALRRQ
jgi:CubicO group peptidase (beta-lactamase class C family)